MEYSGLEAGELARTLISGDHATLVVGEPEPQEVTVEQAAEVLGNAVAKGLENLATELDDYLKGN